MKKVLLLFAMAMLSLSLNAQNYRQSIELSLGVGLDKYSKYAIGIGYQGGIQVKKFYAGLGVGFRYADVLYYTSWDNTGYDTDYYESRDGKYLIPINLRLKYNFTDNKVSPYLLADVGYTFDVGKNPNKNIEGFFVEPQLGIDINLNEGNVIEIGLGANIQNYHYTRFIFSKYDGSEISEPKFMIGILQLHIGFTF